MHPSAVSKNVATGKTFEYDDNGNMTRRGTQTLTWDVDNRLVSIQGGGTTVMEYDSVGQRLIKNGPIGITLFPFDGFKNDRHVSVGSEFRIRVWSYAMTIRSTISLLGVVGVFLANDLTATYRGHYRNEDYGFEVTIPPGYVGQGAAKSAPNHGFVVRTSDGSAVTVDASYDTVVGVSGEDFEHQMIRLKGPPTAILGGLQAWKSAERTVRNKRRILERGIVARRVAEQGDAIIYTISESANEDNHGPADRIFDELVATFRVIPIVSRRH